MNKFIATALLCSFICLLRAQESNDSIPIDVSSAFSEAEIRELTTPLGAPIQGNGSSTFLPTQNSDLPDIPALEPKTYESPKLDINPWPRGSHLPRWATGYMYGYNRQSGNLLYGYIASADIGVHQQLGRYWAIEGGASVNKYSVYYNTAAFHGAVTWQPNQYFSTTVFGQYSTTFLSPIPTMSNIDWGGYITLQTDTDLPFGIDAGARDHYDPIYGHFVTPIVQPFVKIGNSKLGLDFGPIIQDAIMRSQNRDHKGNGIGPIPKPIKTIPQVAPRR